MKSGGTACRGGGGRSTPTGFHCSMRAIHDVSSGSLHTGVMKAFLRGSIRANWPSWINRGGGAERIHQTSPHLCEMSKERHARVLHLSGLNMFGRHSASPRAAVLPLHLAVILILSPYPGSPPHRHPLQIYLPICPRLCPHLRLLIHCPVSGSIERLSVTGVPLHAQTAHQHPAKKSASTLPLPPRLMFPPLPDPTLFPLLSGSIFTSELKP